MGICTRFPSAVMAGLDPAIHAVRRQGVDAWHKAGHDSN
jgi:hypothetical protein